MGNEKNREKWGKLGQKAMNPDKEAGRQRLLWEKIGKSQSELERIPDEGDKIGKKERPRGRFFRLN